MLYYDSHAGATLKGINNYLVSATAPSLFKFFKIIDKNNNSLPKFNKSSSHDLYNYVCLFNNIIYNYKNNGTCMHRFDWSAFSNYYILLFIYIIQKIENISYQEIFQIFHSIIKQYEGK